MVMKASSVYGAGIPVATELLDVIQASLPLSGDETLAYDLTGKFRLSSLVGSSSTSDQNRGDVTKVEVDGVEIYTGTSQLGNLIPDPVLAESSVKIWGRGGTTVGRSSAFLRLSVTAIQ